MTATIYRDVQQAEPACEIYVKSAGQGVNTSISLLPYLKAILVLILNHLAQVLLKQNQFLLVSIFQRPFGHALEAARLELEPNCVVMVVQSINT